MPKGKYLVDLKIPANILSAGEYFPYFSFSDNSELIDSYLEGIKFKVIDTMSERGNNRGALTSITLNWVIANNL